MNINQVSLLGRNGCREVIHLSEVNLKYPYVATNKRRSDTTVRLPLYVHPLATVLFARSLNCYHVRA